MNTFYNNDNISSLINGLPEVANSFQEIIEGMKEYVEYIEKVKINTTGKENDEEMMKMKEKEYDKMKEIIEKRKWVRNKGEETKGKIEVIKKNIEEICSSCEEDENRMKKVNNEMINEMNIIEERIKNSKKKEVMKEIEEKIKEMKEIEEKYKKRYKEREQERIKYSEYKEENKEEYWKYCQGIKGMEEENKEEIEGIIRGIKNVEEHEIIKIVEKMKREEERKRKEEERKRKEEERKRKEEERKEMIKNYGNIHIKKNIINLEKWSGNKFNQVLYNSTIDGKSPEIFRNRIMNHSKLYFIVTDSKNNVFGHYHNGIIDKTDTRIKDDKSYMFSLYSNGRNGVNKFNIKPHIQSSTYIFSDNRYYFNGDGGYFAIYSMIKNGCNLNKISYSYEGLMSPTLTGKDCSNGINLTIKEIVVIEMK